MQPSSKRTFSFLLSLLFLVSAMLVYALLIVPSFRDVQRLRAEVAKLTSTLADQKQAVADLEQLLLEFESLAAARQIFSLTLPNDPRAPQVVNTVRGLAEISGVILTSIQVDTVPFRSLGGPRFVRNIGSLRARITLDGSYDGFKNFMAQLERNVRLMDVKNVIVRTTAGDPTGRALGYDVTFDAYYQEAPTL
jgi:Tfp pilus assembly protein PilO